MQPTETVLVLDFGSQYNQLIARRVREARVFSQVLPHSVTAKQIAALRPRGIILSGGPASVYEKRAPRLDPDILALGVPILGICYGMQILAQMLGGRVERSSEGGEYGHANLSISDRRDLFKGVPRTLRSWMSHGDSVRKAPAGFERLAGTPTTPIAAFADRRRRIYGVQFHPEVAHTEAGDHILRNFLYQICSCRGTWTIQSFIDEKIREIRALVGRQKVVLGLSGGVDSSVAAVLIHKAIGQQLKCIFVDNGLLRKGEREQVRETFSRHFHMDVHIVDARARFLKKLAGVIDPEKKRKIIGGEFIRVFEDEAKKLGKVDFLAQGTLYPDVIESRSAFGGPSATIKTHHNVGGLPTHMKFRLIEPLRELFKDEVRELGRLLGLAEEIVRRQPFPGPGLAVRILGAVSPERVHTLQEVDIRVQDEIGSTPQAKGLWQFFAVLLPVKSVGVMGDARTYENVAAIRAVESRDGMTADWAKLPHEVLGRLSNRIINEVKGVNRVVYDISSKPPSTIEWE